MDLKYEHSELIPVGKKRYFCVEYPGYVKNFDRALATLGGEKQLSESLTNNSPVPLRFRATDIFSHPINGYITKASKLLVKVTRRVKKNKDIDAMEEDATWKVEVEGIIPKTLRFRGLADFQHIVPSTDTTVQLKKALLKGDVQHIIDYKVAEDDNTEDLRNIPPPVFTSTEIPLDYGYRQNAPVIRVRVKQPDGSYKIKLVNRSRGLSTELTSVRFHEENYPTKSWFILQPPKDDIDRDAIEAVRKLFEERPIWSRLNVLAQIHSKYHRRIKTALSNNAFIFSDGPWRDTWVKYGVDPRKDSKYRFYQQVDVRRILSMAPKQKVSSHITLRRQLDGQPLRFKEETSIEKEATGLFFFDGVSVPETRSLFQMAEITDPDISALINNPAYARSELSKRDGYYYKCVNQRIRNSLRIKYNALMTTGRCDRDYSLEEGLLEEVEREKAKIAEGMMDDEDNEDGDTTVAKENAIKDAMQAMDKPGSSKRLTEVVDEYMDELVKGEPLEDDEFLDIETLEDYDEELDGFEDELKEDSLQE